MERDLTMREKLASLFLCFVLMSCAPKAFVPQKVSEIRFEKTPLYEGVDFSKFPKPTEIQPLFMNESMELIDNPDNAAYIVLAPNEYAKIEALLRLLKAYKETIKEQTVLINADIRIINSLKEFIELERQKVQVYQELWADSETLYRQEKYYHLLDNAVNRAALGAITIGSVVLFVLAL